MSLFELERSLAKPGGRKAKPRKRDGVAPAGGARAMAFDNGDPVDLDIGGDLRHTARVSSGAIDGEMPSGWVRSTSLAMLDGGDRGDWVVESFEESAQVDRVGVVRTSAMCLADRVDSPSLPESDEPAMAGDAAEATTTERQPTTELQQIARAHHAEQVSAFERELRGIAAQQERPAPPAASTPAPPQQRAAPPTPTPGSPAGLGHEVFDQMAQGMSYATTFALPSVALRREFREFDAHLDASGVGRASGAMTSAAPPVPSSAASPPSKPVTPVTTVTPVADEVLQSDLDALEEIQRPSPDPASAVTETAHARPAADASNEGEP